MNELVSIIMPSYKRNRELVERAIQSILDQTYQNIELVLVDDNARLELAEFRENISKLVDELNDKRIVYVQNESPQGGAGARNVGINIAKGEYVSFLDDDDVYLPEKIEKQLNFMKEGDLEVSFTNLNIYNEKDQLTDVRVHNLKSFDNAYLGKYHLTKQIVGTPTFMIKRKVLLEVKGFDIVPMGQEWYLMQKIILGNYKIGYFPECYIKAYRTNDEAISTGKNKIIGEKALFRYKKKYFHLLNFKERKFVRCRHYAVMSVAYKRNQKYISSVLMLFVTFLVSPYISISEWIAMKKRKCNN